MPRRHLIWGAALLPAILVALPSPTRAQAGGPTRTTETASGLSVALVISGGASLGVYEAGYLYGLGEVLKRQGIPLRVVTGASAGSGNALLSALSSCAPPNDFPTRDLGYRFWLAQQFDSLFQPTSTTAVSAFIATPGLAALRRAVDEVWQRRLPATCDVALGIPVTRLTPLDVPLQGQLTVPRQLLHFTVRIQGRGDSLSPLIHNTVVPGSRAPQLLLPLAADPDARTASSEDRDRLLQVILASGAFPLAFPAVNLGYCLSPGVDPDACHEPDHQDRFIDGGVFDNIPLGLAGALSGTQAAAGEHTFFVYMNPDLRAYPVPAPRGASRLPNIFSQGATITQGFLGQARGTELFALLDEQAAILDPGRLLIATSRLPQASGFLANFFGLFEREFRRFDFYLGLYDALQDLASWHQLPSERGRQPLEALLSTPEWEPLQCLAQWYDSTATTRHPGCGDDQLRDFRILAQVALNRVYSQCRDLAPDQRARPIANYHCRRAAAGALPPRIVETAVPADSIGVLRNTARKETELGYNLRLLTAYRFHFRDLGVPPDQPGQARPALARRLRAVIETLADRQPAGYQRKIMRLATLAVSSIYYEPPPSWWYVVVGTAPELGASVAVPGALPGWLRFNAAARVQGVVSLLTQDQNEFAVGLFAGPDLELRPLTSPAHMVTIAPRLGYQFSQGDRFRSRACDAARTGDDGRRCSQLVLQAATSVIALERARLQVTLDYFPNAVDFDNRRYDVQVAFGVQF